MNAQLKNSDSICLTRKKTKNMKMIESLDELKGNKGNNVDLK